MSKPLTRTEEIYFYHAYMYGDCDCLRCDEYKSENRGEKMKKQCTNNDCLDCQGEHPDGDSCQIYETLNPYKEGEKMSELVPQECQKCDCWTITDGKFACHFTPCRDNEPLPFPKSVVKHIKR